MNVQRMQEISKNQKICKEKKIPKALGVGTRVPKIFSQEMRQKLSESSLPYTGVCHFVFF